MNALFEQIALGIRLHLRTRMALIYNYLFPSIFLVAFHVLYRLEHPPMLLHMGELLTVTILGSCCFGLPGGLVDDRERGLWRRYRMLPASSLGILGGTLITRYLIVLSAGLLQVGLAIAWGLPLPAHPFALLGAFSVAVVCFMGIGLDIAALAPNVPAVQALGQCIFLPMLIVGGVALPLSNLPNWAQHLSAFLPGRYAVEVIESAVVNHSAGSTTIQFDVSALLVIAVASAIAGILGFRWDTRRRTNFWISAAMLGWIAVGLAAESRHIVHAETVQRVEQPKMQEYVPAKPAPVPTTTMAEAPPAPQKSTWRDVTPADIDGVAFERLPPDDGVIAPIAGPADEPADMIVDQLDQLRTSITTWAPGKVSDPVQRVRNLLYATSVTDLFRMDPLERFVPLIVFDRLQAALPEGDDLRKALYFVATHPQDGTDSAGQQLHELGLPDSPTDTKVLRNRAMIYAFKFLGRLTAASAKH